MKKLACAFLVLLAGVPARAAPLTASRTMNLPDAIDAVTAAAEDSGYQVVKVQPIDQALIKRGYPDPGMRLLFIGDASTVDQAMKINPRLLSVLPPQAFPDRGGPANVGQQRRPGHVEGNVSRS